MGAVEYFFRASASGIEGAFCMVSTVYTCTVSVVYGKNMYKVSRQALHEIGRADIGGRVALPISMVIGKLHRFVDTAQE